MAKPAEINEIVTDFSRVYILTILHEGPVHGYEIISKFKKVIGKEVSPSLVYPFLKQLEQKGLVKHTLKDSRRQEKESFRTNPGRQRVFRTAV